MNKRELSRLLRTSVVSLGNWIEKWPDFPVIDRGTNGREWRFDPAAVVEFLRLKKEQERQEARELGETRDAALSQMILPLSLLVDEDHRPIPGASLKEQKEALQLRVLQRQEAEKLGRLVAVEDVRESLAIAFATISRTMNSALRAVAHDHNLPPGMLHLLRGSIARAQRDAVAAIGDELAGSVSVEIEPEQLERSFG